MCIRDRYSSTAAALAAAAVDTRTAVAHAPAAAADTRHYAIQVLASLMSKTLVQCLIQELLCIVRFWGSYSEPKGNSS